MSISSNSTHGTHDRWTRQGGRQHRDTKTLAASSVNAMIAMSWWSWKKITDTTVGRCFCYLCIKNFVQTSNRCTAAWVLKARQVKADSSVCHKWQSHYHDTRATTPSLISRLLRAILMACYNMVEITEISYMSMIWREIIVCHYALYGSHLEVIPNISSIYVENRWHAIGEFEPPSVGPRTLNSGKTAAQRTRSATDRSSHCINDHAAWSQLLFVVY